MIKNLVLTLGLLLISFTAAYADGCQKVPAATAEQSFEHYVGTDAAKLDTVQGAPSDADEVDIILPAGGGEGLVYYVKAGCILASFPANDGGVDGVLSSHGVTRHKSV